MKKRSCVCPIVLIAYFGLFVVASAQPSPSPGGDSTKATSKDTVIVQQSPVAPTAGSRPSLWRYFSRLDMGLGLHIHTNATAEDLPSSNVVDQVDIVALGVTFGVNLPMVYLSDQMTLGLNPNIDLARILNASGGESISVEATGYATLKYGTDATWAGVNSGFGFAAGFGYRHSVLIYPARVFGYGLPNVLAEISIGKRRSTLGLVKLRYSMSIGSYDYEIDYNDGGPVQHTFFSNHAFHILLTPNF
jgi:hypothetical protein